MRSLRPSQAGKVCVRCGGAAGLGTLSALGVGNIQPSAQLCRSGGPTRSFAGAPCVRWMLASPG